MTAKKVIGKLHLWLGLASGLVVFVVALTGCLYAFQAEIQDATQSYRFVQAENRPTLPPSTLRAIADAQLPPGEAWKEVEKACASVDVELCVTGRVDMHQDAGE